MRQTRQLVACVSCGSIQTADYSSGVNVLACRLCGMVLERLRLRSVEAALACSTATAVLLIPANLLPLLSTTLLGSSLESRLWSGPIVLLSEGWPWLALWVGLFVVIVPPLRFLLLTAALSGLLSKRVRPGTDRLFRYAQALAPWAMADVFLLALCIAYVRLDATLGVTVLPGAICFILAAIGSLITRAALPEAEVWERIRPASDTFDTDRQCLVCGYAGADTRPAGGCARCGARVDARRLDAVQRTGALTIASVVLYILSNLSWMATVPIGLEPRHYTVLEGAIDLFDAQLVSLGLLVLAVSFVIPLTKLVILSWCCLSVIRRSQRLLRSKTRLFRVVEEIGRWSMTDPFAIACFVPVVQYNSLVYAQAEEGASTFALVVLLTMAAARCFDPRLMWDAAR